MEKVAVVLRKSPYGEMNAAEAVRHAMGAASNEWDVSFILMDSGVLLAKKGQNISGAEFTNLEEALTDCINMGVKVYIDKPSLREQHLEAGDIHDRIKIVDGMDIAGLMQEAKATLVF